MADKDDYREDRIQTLLRNSFRCIATCKSSCSCALNISDFLRNDDKSLEWAKRKKIDIGRWTADG